MQFKYELRTDYDQKISLDNSSCLFYSRKIMKEIHPHGDFIIVGSIAKGLKNEIGELHHHDKIVKYYANNYSRLRFKLVGYIAVGENQYIEVVKAKGCQRLILLLLVIALLSFSLFSMLQRTDIDSLAKDYAPANGALVDTDPEHITLPSYERIALEAGTDTAYVALFNPPKNPCYFKFTIFLVDGDKQIYESKLVEPGKAITEVKFNRKFQEGVYPIKIKIDSYSLKKKTALNGGLVESNLVAISK